MATRREIFRDSLRVRAGSRVVSRMVSRWLLRDRGYHRDPYWLAELHSTQPSGSVHQLAYQDHTRALVCPDLISMCRRTTGRYGG